MQQLWFQQPGNLQWREVKSPRLSSDVSALVHPLAVARCDLDTSFANGSFPVSSEFAMGHETVARVTHIGDKVKDIKLGQLVVVPEHISPVYLAAMADNLPDGFRTVAPYLALHPGAEVLK